MKGRRKTAFFNSYFLGIVDYMYKISRVSRRSAMNHNPLIRALGAVLLIPLMAAGRRRLRLRPEHFAITGLRNKYRKKCPMRGPERLGGMTGAVGPTKAGNDCPPVGLGARLSGRPSSMHSGYGIA